MAEFLLRLDPVGWSVLVALLILALGVAFVLSARFWVALWSRAAERRFRERFEQCNEGADLLELASEKPEEHSRHALGRLLLCAVSFQRTARDEPYFAERLYRRLQGQLEREALERDWGMTWIATAASTAPYIGLLGTVWSIYHALLALSAKGEVTLSAVAAPIGEALIMTALGLAVAIPASIAHSVLQRRNQMRLPELESFAHECFLLLIADEKRSVG